MGRRSLSKFKLLLKLIKSVSQIMEDNDIFEKMQSAMVIVDKLLPCLPDYNVFHFSWYAKDKLKWNAKEVSEITLHAPYIKRLMIDQLKYVIEVTQGQLYELTDKGRDAKEAGGHYSYLTKLAKIKKRVERKESYDFLMKKFIYRYRFLPYFVSIFGLIISVGTVIWVQTSKNISTDLGFSSKVRVDIKKIHKDSIIVFKIPNK